MEAHIVFKLAVAAQLHPDTIKRYLGGASVRYLTRLRLESAMRKLGLAEHIVPARERADDTQPAGAR